MRSIVRSSSFRSRRFKGKRDVRLKALLRTFHRARKSLDAKRLLAKPFLAIWALMVLPVIVLLVHVLKVDRI